MDNQKKDFAIINRSGKVLFKMSAKKAQTVVKKYSRKSCKKTQERCQRTVHVLNIKSGNVKVYRFISRKIQPKTIQVESGSFKIKKTIKVVYLKSYNLY